MKVALQIVTVGVSMFTALFVLALIAVGASAAAVVARKKRARALGGGRPVRQLGSGSDTLLERGFSEMRVGDIMQHEGTDYLVEGVNSYDEAGRRWQMAYLVDGKEKVWLLVGLDRSGSAAKSFLRPTKDLDINDYPSEVLVLGEDTYRFDKRGTATVSLDGNTAGLGGGNGESQPGAAHRCRWWNYQGPGDQVLLIEQWGDDYRILTGHSLGDTDIEMMPGS